MNKTIRANSTAPQKIRIFCGLAIVMTLFSCGESMTQEPVSIESAPEIETTTEQLDFYPKEISVDAAEPPFSDLENELWAKLKGNSLIALKARGEIPVSISNTGACQSYAPHLKYLYNDGFGPAISELNLAKDVDLANYSFALVDHIGGVLANISYDLKNLVLEIVVLCPAKYANLVEDFAFTNPWKFHWTSGGGDCFEDFLFPRADCKTNSFMMLVQTFIVENSELIESRTGGDALIGDEPPTPWTGSLGAFNVEDLWFSCQLSKTIKFPPTQEDVTNLKKAQKALVDAYEQQKDEFFLIHSAFPAGIVEYYKKYPNDEYLPSTYSIWRSRCEESDLQFWFTEFGFK